MVKSHNPIKLYSKQSERLYLNTAERKRFAYHASKQETQTKLLCLILLYTGCRITEALNLRICDLQIEDNIIAITSIKKRDKHHVRQIPVPNSLMIELNDNYQHHHIYFHPFAMHRSTAWRKIKKIMKQADIVGEQATLKGLRHSFAVHCALRNVAITMCSKWLGHSSLEITTHYYRVVGTEEREIASRLWEE